MSELRSSDMGRPWFVVNGVFTSETDEEEALVEEEEALVEEEEALVEEEEAGGRDIAGLAYSDA